ncbi:MAG: hypothetical protein WCX17_04895 [Parcubacteria group bacterium]|jgi:hypothetical protein
MVDFKDVFKGVNEAGQWITLITNFFEKAPQEIKNKLPTFLGLSLEDERRWGKLWAQLGDDNETKKNLTDFLEKHCEGYERNHFRYVVVGIPQDAKTVKRGTGKDVKTETIPDPEKNFALDFLRQLAKVIKELGPAEAKRQCIVGGSIVMDPFFRETIKEWIKGNNWFKRTIFAGLGISSFSELTLDKINTALENRFFEIDSGGKPKEDWRGNFIPKKKEGEAKLKSMIYKIIGLALFLGAVAYIIYSL